VEIPPLSLADGKAFTQQLLGKLNIKEKLKPI